MRNRYIKPGLEVLEIENNLLKVISDPDVTLGRPEGGETPKPPQPGGGTTPGEAKPGFPWEDDFEFSLD